MQFTASPSTVTIAAVGDAGMRELVGDRGLERAGISAPRQAKQEACEGSAGNRLAWGLGNVREAGRGART